MTVDIGRPLASANGVAWLVDLRVGEPAISVGRELVFSLQGKKGRTHVPTDGATDRTCSREVDRRPAARRSFRL
jgi:hypothetical protein